MFNINVVTAKEYSAAGVNNKSLIRLIGKIIYWLFVAVGMIIIEVATYIFRLIFPKTPADISNQLALVTGGGNGMGRAFCFRLAKLKCDVAVVDIDYQSAVATAAEIQEEFKVKCKAFHCDISDYSAVLELKSKIEKEMKPIDILVNNAGLLYMSNFLSSDVNDIKRVIDVNITSQIMMIHTFLPGMIERKRGRILSVASMATYDPIPITVVYTSTKFALEGFMSCLYDELSLQDIDEFIKFTTVHPDFTNTRKELSDALDQVNYEFPRLTPEKVAREAIHGLLTGERKVYVSYLKSLHFVMRHYPYSVRKYFLKVTTDVKSLLKKHN